MNTALLKELTDDFTANRQIAARAIHEMRVSDSGGFAKAAAKILHESIDAANSKFLLAILIGQHDYLQVLCDPDAFTPAQSVALLRRAKALDLRVEWKLARLLAAQNQDSDLPAPFVSHCLEVLIQLSEDGSTFPALRELMRCSSARVRSKTALLIGRISHNPQWAKSEDLHHDGRVMDNSVESIWGLDSPATKQAFRDAAASDRHRTAANAAIGLYLARESEAIGLLFRFARRENAGFRAASAWAMGRTGDPRFLPILEVLKTDSTETVRRSADHARAILIAHLKQLHAAGVLDIQIRTAQFHDGEHTLHVMVGNEGASHPQLDALNFVVLNGMESVQEYTLAKMRFKGAPIYELRFRGPQAPSRLVRVEVFTEYGSGEDTDFERIY